MAERNISPLYESRADFLKALAHPGRLYMVDLLASREYCVQELADETGYDISTVSRHLAQMKRAAIVDSRREGTNIRYRLSIPCVRDLFRCMEAAVQGRLEREMAQCACAVDKES